MYRVPRHTERVSYIRLRHYSHFETTRRVRSDTKETLYETEWLKYKETSQTLFYPSSWEIRHLKWKILIAERTCSSLMWCSRMTRVQYPMHKLPKEHWRAFPGIALLISLLFCLRDLSYFFIYVISRRVGATRRDKQSSIRVWLI